MLWIQQGLMPALDGPLVWAHFPSSGGFTLWCGCPFMADFFQFHWGLCSDLGLVS